MSSISRDISNKIQTTVKLKQKAGEFIGAFASYGYKKSFANKNKLIVDEYASEIVKQVFFMYIQGIGKQSIAKILNEKGILCPSEYKKMNGENYKNSKRLETTSYWTYTTINAMLHNEMYIGNMIQGKKHQRMRSKQHMIDKENWIRVEGTHEAIIDRDTWEKVQNLLRKKYRDIDFEKNRSIFSGFIQCGDCGRAMVKNCSKHADGSHVYAFCCGTYKRIGKKYCTSHIIPFEVLYDIVMRDLKEIICGIENLQEIVKHQLFKFSKGKCTTVEKTMKIKMELEKVRKMKKTIYEDYKEKLISKEEFISYRDEYRKKENLYTNQMQVFDERQKKDTMPEKIMENSWLKRLTEQKDIQMLDREIVVEMIDHITVYENYKIKISYNFGDEMRHLLLSEYNIDADKKVKNSRDTAVWSFLLILKKN